MWLHKCVFFFHWHQGVSPRIITRPWGTDACDWRLGCNWNVTFRVKWRRNSGDHCRTLTIFIPWNIQAALYPVSTQPSTESDVAILKATCEHMVAWQTQLPQDGSPGTSWKLFCLVFFDYLDDTFNSMGHISDHATPTSQSDEDTVRTLLISCSLCVHLRARSISSPFRTDAGSDEDDHFSLFLWRVLVSGHFPPCTIL